MTDPRDELGYDCPDCADLEMGPPIPDPHGPLLHFHEPLPPEPLACASEHPYTLAYVPCLLDAGHDGDHESPAHEMTWPREGGEPMWDDDSLVDAVVEAMDETQNEFGKATTWHDLARAALRRAAR